MSNFSSIKDLIDIESRLEHIENLALWIAKETASSDQALSQTGALISIVCEDLREKIIELVKKLENQIKEFEKFIQ